MVHFLVGLNGLNVEEKVGEDIRNFDGNITSENILIKGPLKFCGNLESDFYLTSHSIEPVIFAMMC